MKEKMADYFKVLSDPNRLDIIELLIKGETCGCTLIDKVSVSQPTLSYHLKNITKVGLARSKREGNWIKHFINKEALDDIIEFLIELRDMEADQCSL